ncbi:LPS assembly lipoprotein LptE [Luteimonas sp. 50]|uniref:LPS-assembly lipoprotein LptE n=1 Tax=Cognatiluteimonas sedimenti TaxID=2927791 RepID=A0ABT0A4V7_9GAMM|nr:LPS assembly lipoprotein LptE [Lysobacter sedimenti]MCJ0826014.1 LPS assembly lipoprotein LptE [Lysobacter sedimenti]
MTRQALTATLAMLLLLGLAACGFHLRDALLLPPDLGPIRLVARNPDSALALALGQALERAGATMAADDATDVATLNLVGERWGNTPISVDQFGRAQEFTLRYAAIFSLRRADGSDLVPQQAIELSRDYISVPTRSEGTDDEREILSREMRRDMVASILRRIDAVSRMSQAQGVGPAAPAGAEAAGLDSAGSESATTAPVEPPATAPTVETPATAEPEPAPVPAP